MGNLPDGVFVHALAEAIEHDLILSSCEVDRHSSLHLRPIAVHHHRVDGTLPYSHPDPLYAAHLGDEGYSLPESLSLRNGQSLDGM